jgi:phage-related minor tail protein
LSSRIKGITIELGSDTVGLQKALSDVNKHSSKLQSELKDVERLLKFDPGNTEALAQKQKLLAEQVSVTTDKLNRLKDAEQQVQAQFEKGEISEQQYRSLKREIEFTEGSLKKMESALSKLDDGNELKNLSKDAEKAKQSVGELGQKLQDTGGNMQSAGGDIATSFGAASVAIGAGLGLAAKKAMDFEAQMSSVNSVMAPEEVTKYSSSLEELANVMGAKTKYSAIEAAQGIEELVKAGVSVEDILSGGLEGALSLATAGELELADAAEIASTALNSFRDDNLSVIEAADILAGAANASATSVGELKYGLSMVSAVASGVGLNFKDTSTALALFAQNGLKGSDAGTSLKTMLMNLQPSTDAQYDAFMDLGLMTYDVQKGMDVLRKNGITPLGDDFDTVDSQLRAFAAELEGVKPGTAKAEKAFRELTAETGVIQSAFFDANGSIKDMSDIAGLLQNSMTGMTDAQRLATMETMFGSDAIRAANILFKEGADGIDNMAAAMGKVGAADVAAEKMNNLKGKIEELSGAFETGLISLGTALTPLLEKLVGVLQKITDGFNNLSPGMKQFIAISAVVVAAITGIIATFGIILAVVGSAITGFGALITAFPIILTGLTALRTAFALLTGPIGIIIAIITTLAILIYKNWDEIKAKTIEIWSSISEWFSNTLGSIVTFFSSSWDSVKIFSSEAWESIKQTAINVWTSIKDSVIAIITPFINGALNIFNGMKEGLQKIFDGLKLYYTGVWNLIKNIFLGAVLLIVDLVTGDFEGLKEDSKAIFENIKKALFDIWEGIKTVFSGAVEAILGYVNAAWENLKTTSSTVLTGLKTTISNIWEGIKTFFTTTVEKIKTGVSDGFENMKIAIDEKMTAAKNKIEEIWEKVKGFFTSIDLKQVGKDIIQGLIDGIGSMINAVSDKVKEVAGSIKDAIKGALDINSPSRVMRDEVGKWIPLGIADGITQNLNSVKNASRKMADATIPSSPITNSSISNSYGNINVTIPVKDIHEFNSVVDFFNRLPQAVRAR